jgi:hypothetical protein
MTTKPRAKALDNLCVCKHEGCNNPVQNSTLSTKGYKQIYNRCSACAGNIKRYGITVPQRDAMLANQGGCCKACGSEIAFAKRSEGALASHQAVVDHCHDKGHIRGVLCGHCNCALGKVKDSVERLEALIRYLT